MRLKHMQVQYTHIPNLKTTSYYAFGSQNGTMYEAHVTITDAEIIALNNFQLEQYVTQKLQDVVREVTPQELAQREQEMRGDVLQ